MLVWTGIYVDLTYLIVFHKSYGIILWSLYGFELGKEQLQHWTKYLLLCSLNKVCNVINYPCGNLFLCFGELFHKSCFIVWAVLCWDFIGLKGVFKSQTGSSIGYPFSRPAWSEQGPLHPSCGFHGLAFNMSQWCLFQWSQPCIRLAKHTHTPTSLSSPFTQPYTK